MRLELECRTCGAGERREVDERIGDWTVQHACQGPGAPWWRVVPTGSGTGTHTVTVSTELRLP